MRLDVFALDNALVDVLVRADDALLATLGLEKGVCSFPPDDRFEEILARAQGMDPSIEPGGSAANMATLLARLGASVAFCSAVGKDDFGELYERDLARCGVASYLRKEALPTGTAIAFITPDAQRTFADRLGASLALRAGHLPRDAIARSAITYVSGYLLEDRHLREAALEAMRIARENGGRVAIDLSDPALMERIRADTLALLRSGAFDIVFANEAEARALTGEDAESALAQLAAHAGVAVVKVGARGSLVRQGGETARVPAHVVTPVDTTGAGDAYAAGFLYGLIRGEPIATAGALGALLASEVITVVGARLQELPEKGIAALLAR